MTQRGRAVGKVKALAVAAFLGESNDFAGDLSEVLQRRN
jgi:hypothetical protein